MRKVQTLKVKDFIKSLWGIDQKSKTQAQNPASSLEYTRYSGNLRFSAGFTLMELLVYMMIVGVIVIIAGQAFSDSTKVRIRTQSMVEANAIAGNVGSLLKIDVAQMGAKSAIDASNSTTSLDVFYVAPEVYVDPDNADASKIDSSSFVVSKDAGGEKLDSLTLFRMNYSAAGAYQRVEKVAWYAKNDVLYRSCMTVVGTPDADNCPAENPLEVEIASGVSSFEVIPAKPGVLGDEGIVFPKYASDLSNRNFKFMSRYGTDNFARIVATPETGGTSIALSGFLTNYVENSTSVPSDPYAHQVFAATTDVSGSEWASCTPMTFKKDSTYEISFGMVNNGDESRMFRPDIDHFAVGLRRVSGTNADTVIDVPDYYFYPPENDKGIAGRTMRFSSHRADFQACVAFTFAFYSPTVSMGQFTIANLIVRRVGSVNYDFTNEAYDPLIKDKKNVRALKVRLIVKRNGEAGNAELIIPVPSNGIDD